MTETDPSKFDAIHWMAPELARLGVKNEDWVRPHCEEAVAMFGNQGMHHAAILMAAANRYAIDYLRQAPVIVLGVTRGHPLDHVHKRKLVFTEWSMKVEQKPRLPDLMRQYKLAPQLRAINTKRIVPRYFDVVEALSKIDPPTLAQVIPASGQFSWLRVLKSAHLHMQGRGILHREEIFRWLVSAIAASGDFMLRDTLITTVTGTLDFIDANGLNPKWSLPRAIELSSAWHAERNAMTQEQDFIRKFGRSFDEQFDHGPFPREAKVNGYTFVKLLSGRDLAKESDVMHHCVHSYGRDLISGSSVIYSVRMGDDHIATAQFAKIEGSGRYELQIDHIDIVTPLDDTMVLKQDVIKERWVDKWRLVQIKAHCNNRPPEGTVDAAYEFLSGCTKQPQEPRHADYDPHYGTARRYVA